jgi:uncharacterized protein YggE
MAPLLAAALLAAASPPPEPAPPAPPSPVRLPPLAPGEVLVQVYGIGGFETPATRAVLTLHATGTGATAAEASRTLEATLARISEAARAAGAGPADIAVSRPRSDSIFATDVIPPAVPEAYATIVVHLSDPAAAQPLQDRLVGIDAVIAERYESPRYTLADERPALAEARRRAVAAARADAESYAAALGMRVARSLRIDERRGPEYLTLILQMQPAPRPEPRPATRPAGGGGGDRLASTMAVVSVDFVLVPR